MKATVFLIDSTGKQIPFGTFEGVDERAIISRAARKNSATVKRLTLPGYHLAANSTRIPLDQLKAKL